MPENQTTLTPPTRYSALFNQMLSQKNEAQSSAQKILQILFQRYIPSSVVDFGCGIGNWLSVARQMGVPLIHGVDANWLNPTQLTIEPNLVTITDLQQPINLGRKFDLAICLETAEHLKPTAADTIVQTLVKHAPAILFSAAIPFQRGPGHVNEQWPGYWVEKFNHHGYASLDFIRNIIWYDDDVLWWYRQNVLLFVDFEWCKSQPGLFKEGQIQSTRRQPNAIVLPHLFETVAERLFKLENQLKQGGNFNVQVDQYDRVELIPDPNSPSNNPHGKNHTPHLTISTLTSAPPERTSQKS